MSVQELPREEEKAVKRHLESGDLVQKIIAWIIVAAFSLMTISALMQVFFRYVVGNPLGWTVELARIMFIWFVFLSVGILTARRRLLAIDVFVIPMRIESRYAVSIFVNITIILVYSVTAIAAARMSIMALGQPSPALGLPYTFIYLSLPAGLVIGGVYATINLWRDVARLRSGQFDDAAPETGISIGGDI